MKILTRRDFLKVTGIGALSATAALTLAACGRSGSAGGDSVISTDYVGADLEKGDVSGALAAAEGTEFIMIDEAIQGCTLIFPTLGPFRNANMQRGLIIRYLYDRLAYVNVMGVYVPQGARSWEVAEDGITWTVELYDYITDSAGRNITADDVIWFIEESKARATRPVFSSVASTEKLSNYTLKIVMTENIADNFELLLESIFVVSRESFESDADGFAYHPICSSPYEVVEFEPNSSITFLRRDDFWQTEDELDDCLGANIKQMSMIVIAEASQQQVALETGLIDAMPAIDASVAENFLNNEDYLVAQTPSANGYSLRFSGASDKLIANDLNLRMAISCCINVDALISGAANGYAEPMYDLIPRTSSGFQDKWMSEPYFPYDVEKAKAYLADSGYKNEELILAGNVAYSKMYTIIQANCQAIGINVKLDLQESSLWNTNSKDGRLWDMAVVACGNGGASIWTTYLDCDVYEYGNAQALKDDVLNDMLHYTWQNANYTPENIDKVHRYLTDNAYIRGLYLPQIISVARKEMGIAETQFNNTGNLDIAASKYAK